MRALFFNLFPHSILGLFGFLAVFSAEGKDHFLVVAGGQSAANNQVSLEKNLHFFRKVLQETAPQAALTEYFSSGNEDIRSVQFETAEAKVPSANEYMARLFGSTDYLNLQYREHQLGEVTGATSTANLNGWFNENGKKLESDDRLVIYVTAHGGRSRDKQQPNNTTIKLWNRQSVDVRGLQENLKKLPDDVTVILVMAQCFSGGFAHSIFNETESDSGNFDLPIAGFFATVASREAAGCTPDINEEAYDEFSSHFWAAMRGEDRLGNAIGNADYDGDGQVSFDEAYGYTVLVSRNIDIPMKTSGAFLRARSQFADDVSNDQLLKRYTPYSKTLELAEPVEKKLLEGLSERLKLRGESRYAAAEKKAGEIETKRAVLKRQYDAKKQILEGHRNAIRDTLYGRWPELSNLLTEQSVRLVTKESEDFVKVVEDHLSFNAWNTVAKERYEIDEERFALEKEWAQYIRFLRAHNNVVLAENLHILANPEDLSRFGQIRQAERAGINKAMTASK